MKNKIEEIQRSLNELEKKFESISTSASENLKIDIYNLEECCSTHSNHFLEVALFASEVGLLANKAELLFKEVKASTASDIRANPDKYNIQKVTEGTVSEAVETSEIVNMAGNLKIECWKLKNEADSFVQAFEHRRSMLNNEVQLYLSNLSEPKAEVKRKDVERELVKRKKLRGNV